MSIEVTCSCAATYRLPDRYAGKRCRCRECGGRIEVPEEVSASPKKRRGGRKGGRRRRDGRAKREAARRTTRRLSSQEQEIRGARRALRPSSRRPVSESMHQLAPMTLSGQVERPETLGPPVPRKARKRRRDSAEERQAGKRKQKGRAGEREAAPTGDERSTKRRKKKGSAAGKGGAKAERKPQGKREQEKGKRPGKGKKARRAAPEKGKKKGAPAAPRPKKGRGAAPARRLGAGARRAGGRADADGDEGERSTPAGKRGRGRQSPVQLAVITAAALTVLIGLAVGLAWSGSEGTAAQGQTAAKLEYVAGLREHGQWDVAKVELERLEKELIAAGAMAEAARVQEERVAVDMMVQLAEIEDEYQRLETLISYAEYADPTVRRGVAFELGALGENWEAQETLATLARDDDEDVAAAARHALVEVGGPMSIPYLQAVIEETAATGGERGDHALEKALELYEPEVGPVLVRFLELRPEAPAPTLAAVLDHLRELGDPSSVEAARPFLDHADPTVQESAKGLVETLGA